MATNQGALYFVCLPMKDAVHFNSPSPWYVNAKLGVWDSRQVRFDPPLSFYASFGVSSDVDVRSRCDVSRPACRTRRAVSGLAVQMGAKQASTSISMIASSFISPTLGNVQLSSVLFH